MTEEKVQFISYQAYPAAEVDDITVKVAYVESVPYQALATFYDNEKLSTTINGVDISYLTRFVLPYADAYEQVDYWSTQQDITLL